MSITLKAVDFIDKLKLDTYFVKSDDKISFTPIKLNFNERTIESIIDRLVNSNGKSYSMNDFEKNIISELDF